MRMLLPLLFLLLIAYSKAQKFTPPGDGCMVFIGQDLEAVGGLENFNQGYCDYFTIPAGITVYHNLSPGDNSFGHFFEGLDGLKSSANWGAGESNASLYLQDSSFSNSAIAIGLSFVNHEKEIARGKLDNQILELADWIKMADRPIFLRIGYEFDGWEWNHYIRKHYLASWNRTYCLFEKKKVDNVAFVWQSKGTGTEIETLEEWYPGDSIIDWCAYSYFGNPDKTMLDFARNHNKPVFIAEATPVREIEGLYSNTDLKSEGLDSTIWDQWFESFFKTIEENRDVIKAFSYINCDWTSQPMWNINPVFSKVDSRIQVSEYVTRKWNEKINQPHFLKTKDVVWKY